MTDEITRVAFLDEHYEERQRAVEALLAECPREWSSYTQKPIVAGRGGRSGARLNEGLRAEHSDRRLRHLSDGSQIFCIRPNVSLAPGIRIVTGEPAVTDAQAALDRIPAGVRLPPNAVPPG